MIKTTINFTGIEEELYAMNIDWNEELSPFIYRLSYRSGLFFQKNEKQLI